MKETTKFRIRLYIKRSHEGHNMHRIRFTPQLLWSGLAGLGLATLGGCFLLQHQDNLQAQTQKPSPRPTITAKSKAKPTPASPTTAAKPDPVFVGAGDIAICNKPDSSKTAELIDQIPGTVFTTGDNAYQKGTVEEFKTCYDPAWGRFKARTYPTPGNHDYYSTDAVPYYAYFGERAGTPGKGYYSYDLGEWHVVALNSNIDAQTGSAQEKWLKADLAAHPKTCTLAYWHHPVFSSGTHGNDPKMKDLWQTLYDAGADVVVNGHDHNYERFSPQTPEGKSDNKHGIREFVVGTGGAELRAMETTRPNSEVRNPETYGVIKFVLQPKSYSWEFIPIKGQTFMDKGTQACT
jgi:acid phosphatase type 7